MNTIKTAVQNGIATVTFHRQQVRNAVNLEMVEELHQALDQFLADEQVKVVVFTGEGSTFLSGGDLEQFLSVRGTDSYPLLKKAGDFLSRLYRFEKPTIAMINGHAIGGGCEFAASCHFRFASREAVLGFVQITMNITTGWGGGSRLLCKLPESKALALLLTGDRMSALEAKEWGFVDRVLQAEELAPFTYSFAEKIARQPLSSIQAYLRMLEWRREGMALEECVEKEIRQCSEMWGNEGHLRAVAPYLRKLS